MKYAAALVGIAAAALVGMVMGRNPAALTAQVPSATPVASATPDYYPLPSRTIKLPIKYEKDRKAIRQVMLYVARNGENTWYQEGAVPPDRDAFTYIAKEDGVYWFTMVIEDLQGRKDPADLTRTAPDLKVIVDTIRRACSSPIPARRRGSCRGVASGRQAPDDNNTKVHFRPAGSDGSGRKSRCRPGRRPASAFPLERRTRSWFA